MQPITLVAGTAGSGKTTWIRQQLSDDSAALYLCPSADSVPIDATYLATELPALNCLNDSQWPELLSRVTAGQKAYIELGFHLDLTALALPVDPTQCRRVAVLPPSADQTEWLDWAGAIVIGSETTNGVGSGPESRQIAQLWRAPLSGRVLDIASLNTFWDELTQAAYGQIQRAKGIFEVEDGRAVYYSFVAGQPNEQIELNLPRWLEGRPERFSGIELWGDPVQADIIQTLADCCLEDDVIAYYQAQVKAVMQEAVMQEDVMQEDVMQEKSR